MSTERSVLVAPHQFDHRFATDRSVQPGAMRDNLAPRPPTGIVLLTVAQDGSVTRSDTPS